MAVKNKHGRKGIKKYVPQVPLSDQQRTEVRERGYADGWKAGERSALLKALELANGSRSIRDARRRIEELVNAQA